MPQRYHVVSNPDMSSLLNSREVAQFVSMKEGNAPLLADQASVG
jgi:hypothetical protein